MSEYSCFDIIGPVMVGRPVRIQRECCAAGPFCPGNCRRNAQQVEILLHGSFAKTYKGHGTDLALLGGMLGMETDDVRIRDSYRLADEAGLRYQFVPADLGDGYHANTAKFVMTTASGETKTVVGCSVGGGKVLITELDGFPVEIEGIYPTLLIPIWTSPV